MTASILEIRAGKTAFAHIQRHGLSPRDIRAVLGASGAAKWLGIYGLDRAIFSQWLNNKAHPLYVMGTSIGAWKLAAACRNNPAKALDTLKDAYIRQSYTEGITPERITQESLKIFDRVFPLDKVRQIIDHPVRKLGFCAVKSHGIMALENPGVQILGMTTAWGGNLLSRKTQALFFQRTLFEVPGAEHHNPLDWSEFIPARVRLDTNNFHSALMASGSIPVIMTGISDISGAPRGVYRDGGILDYHPVIPMAPDQDGFILYPHFYPWLAPGWFDKKRKTRWAGAEILDRTILVCPSSKYVEQLPFGRIPDRKDFTRFRAEDARRCEAWHRAARMSLGLGQRFLDLVSSKDIAKVVQPF